MIRRHELKLVVPWLTAPFLRWKDEASFRVDSISRRDVWCGIWRRLRLGSLIVAKAVWKIARR